jgi:hypothetical protein
VYDAYVWIERDDELWYVPKNQTGTLDLKPYGVAIAAIKPTRQGSYGLYEPGSHRPSIHADKRTLVELFNKRPKR